MIYKSHMKRVLLSLFIFLLSSPAFALDLETIRFGQHGADTRIVIETSEPADFKSFILPNPERLIVDLPLFVWQAGDMTIPLNPQIKNVRYAVHKPGVSRIVFELAQAKTIKAAFKLDPLENGNHRLVIDLKPGGHTGIDTHGSLNTEKVALTTQNTGTLTPTPSPVRGKKPLIVIDPGHGGTDPGAISPQKIHEKNIVLPMAHELKDALEASGKYRVKLTRTTDTYITLGNRVKLSRQWGADMFISLHADSIDNSSIRGASIYTLSNTASDKLSAKLAEKENKSDIIAGVDLTHEDKVVVDILTSLAMRDTQNQSRFFANLLVDSFKNKGVRTLPNTHRYAGFAVLKAPDVPAVLIEAGFVSNRTEAQQLSDRSYRRKVIGAIQTGIDTYFDKTL